MNAKILVTEETVDRYKGKNGEVEQHIVRGVEVGTEDNMAKFLDYMIGPDEVKLHFGKLKGSTLDLGLRDFRGEFGGRLRVTGRIIKVGR